MSAVAAAEEEMLMSDEDEREPAPMTDILKAAAIKTAHFWLSLVSIVLLAANEVELIPLTGVGHKLFTAGMLVLTTLGYGYGLKWSPPRRPWTADERAARGLPPAQPPAPTPKP